MPLRAITNSIIKSIEKHNFQMFDLTIWADHCPANTRLYDTHTLRVYMCMAINFCLKSLESHVKASKIYAFLQTFPNHDDRGWLTDTQNSSELGGRGEEEYCYEKGWKGKTDMEKCGSSGFVMVAIVQYSLPNGQNWFHRMYIKL